MEKRGKIDRGKIRSDTEYIGKKASIQGWIGPMFLRHSTYLSIFDDPSNGYGWISLNIKSQLLLFLLTSHKKVSHCTLGLKQNTIQYNTILPYIWYGFP